MTMFVRSWSRKSIAGATVAAAILAMPFAHSSSMARENPPPAAGVSAPTSSEVSPAARPVAPAKHHKKKQSFGQRLKSKFEKKLHKVMGPKKAAASKRNAPAKNA